MPLRLFDDDFRLEMSSRELEALIVAVGGCCEDAFDSCGEVSDGIAMCTVERGGGRRSCFATPAMV